MNEWLSREFFQFSTSKEIPSTVLDAMDQQVNMQNVIYLNETILYMIIIMEMEICVII